MSAPSSEAASEIVFDWHTIDAELMKQQIERVIAEDDQAGARGYLHSHPGLLREKQMLLFNLALERGVRDPSGYSPALSVLSVVKKSGFSLPWCNSGEYRNPSVMSKIVLVMSALNHKPDNGGISIDDFEKIQWAADTGVTVKATEEDE